ncbi:ubiquitin carboxyl-terminal hydrolase 29-like [Acomys russatus]|uniref:ubiquitin carboxyl-terminal hydrolase 29-like n=1 Tax=Acomys russatus TaxID=60746 RepID=UPI0021E22A0E|nr:ubiquitin carboxyl-terminal hydrolase 29-like [Acomys russatus]
MKRASVGSSAGDRIWPRGSFVLHCGLSTLENPLHYRTCFICEEGMARLKIQCLVQVRSKSRSERTRASQWKEGVIEVAERNQIVNLVVFFKLEERRRVFPLGDNIVDVAVTGSELELYQLHLTLRDESSLLLSRLSSKDVEHLKSFLGSFNPCESHQPLEPESNRDILESLDPLCREHQGPSCGPPKTTPGSKVPLSQNMPLPEPNSTGGHVAGRSQGKGEKRKAESSPSAEENKDILKGSDLEPKKKRKRAGGSRRGGKGAQSTEKPASWGKPEPDDTAQASPTPCLKLLKRQGFPNLGNTCYMNSILQSVFGIPIFVKDLLTQGIPWDFVPHSDLLKPLGLLLVLKDIQDVDAKGNVLMDVMRSISMVTDTFLSNEQNDAHEFLSLCLEQLKLSMERLNVMWDTMREKEGEKSSLPTASTKRFVCPVGANFEMELQKSIVCDGCGEAIFKTEVSSYLSIDLRQGTSAPPLSIQECFDVFFTPEEIERNCEKCKNKNSVLRYSLRRLPKVLIVHLKRYQVTPEMVLTKNKQPVEISQYLYVSSSLGRENRKPPFPLANTGPNRVHTVPNVSQGVLPEILSQPMLSMQVTSESSDPTVRGDADPGVQIRMDEDTGEGWLQRDLESGSRLEPAPVKTANRMLSELPWPAPDAMATISESIRFQDPGLQEVAKDPKLKHCERINVRGKSDGRFQEKTSQLHQDRGDGVKKELFLQASLPSVSTQEDTGKDPSSHSEFRVLQENDPRPLGASGSATNTVNAIGGSKSSEVGEDPHKYRLVSVVSHFGDSPNSGHYISDVYDFQRQVWHLYSDLKVFEIPDSLTQEYRDEAGYIFFYMRDEIFEELLKKASECKLTSTSKEEKKEIDLSLTVLYSYINSAHNEELQQKKKAQQDKQTKRKPKAKKKNPETTL